MIMTSVKHDENNSAIVCAQWQSMGKNTSNYANILNANWANYKKGYSNQFPNNSIVLNRLIGRSEEINIITLTESGSGRKANIYSFDFFSLFNK